MAKLKKRQGHHARCRATFISAHGEHTMINDILSRLYAHWLDTSCQRQRQIEHNARSIFKRAVPAWGLRVLIARHVLYFHFCLHFSDLKWRYSRKLASDEESIATATLMWEAYMGGYRSYKEYGYLQWLESRDLTRQRALPQGGPVLALPEGRESVLLREIKQIEKESYSGCGLYYEIYEPRVLRALRALKSKLRDYDLAIYLRILPDSGWDLSDEAYEASRQAESELWDELHGEYDCGQE